MTSNFTPAPWVTYKKRYYRFEGRDEVYDRWQGNTHIDAKEFAKRGNPWNEIEVFKATPVPKKTESNLLTKLKSSAEEIKTFATQKPKSIIQPTKLSEQVKKFPLELGKKALEIRSKIGEWSDKKTIEMGMKGGQTREEAEKSLAMIKKATNLAMSFTGGTISPITKELTSVEKITQALKKAKPLRGIQEKLYTAERAQRITKAVAVGEKTVGEAGFRKELGQFTGEYTKVDFEALRKQISQTDIDNVFIQIKNSKLLNYFDSINARKGFAKILEGKVPTEGELTLLGRVLPKEFIETVLSKRDLFTKAMEAGYQIANVPRALMASIDVSAPLRQGIFLLPKQVATHPIRTVKTFVEMFKSLGSEKAFKALQESIVRKRTFNLMQEGKLALTDMNAILVAREERFMSSWAEKIPIIGKLVRASGRAYTGFLNKLRADVFEDMILKGEKMGLKIDTDLAKTVATYVNRASGRGSLGALEPAASALNTVFFSPRLMASRLQLLNPVYYATAPKLIRQEALKSLLAFIGAGGTTLYLAKLGGANVGTDPRSADFGKIIVGNTRIDVWGGFQQWIRSLSQILSGQYVSSVTGKLVTLGEGYKPLTRWDIALRQFESKEAPVISFITTLMRGQTTQGEKVSIPKELLDRVTPMALSDLYDIYKEDPDLLPISGLAFFGVGLQTYSTKKGPLPTEEEKKEMLEISKRLGQQEKTKEEFREASKTTYAELKKLSKEKGTEFFDQLIKDNPNMANKINDLIEEDQLELTPPEKYMKDLNIENGERVKYIFDKFKIIKTTEEKTKFISNLIKKKVITKIVSEQLEWLLAGNEP